MNKSTKIWLNYTLGGIISIVLLYSIWLQIRKQLAHVDVHTLAQTGPIYFLVLSIVLMPANLMLEARKWHLLARTAQPLSYWQAFTSYLAGLAFSMVTPNRIGEYPGRILYLKSKNTFRLIGASILGAVAQFLTLLLFGILGLTYYVIAYGSVIASLALAGTIIGAAVMAVVYFRIGAWLPLLQRFRWLRKYHVYGQLLRRYSYRRQLQVLVISILRFSVFTAQYLFLLRWMNVYMPLPQGYCMAALFFWAMAIIPSIALAELGERGQVSLFLFRHFSHNAIGIVGATVGIWFLNLILPSVVGSILLFRMRLLK